MRRTAAILTLALSLAAPAAGQTVTRRAGGLTVMVDQSLSFPGGLLLVRLQSRRGLAAVNAILDGRRCPFFSSPRGLRALVPIPPTHASGPVTLGIEIRGGRGRSRVPVTVAIAAREYPPRTISIPEERRYLVIEPGVVRNSRQVLQQLRTETPRQRWSGPFQPPVDAQPLYSYGAPTTYVGAAPVEVRTDSVFGEYHRGMDYAVPNGTVVQAPAAGAVLKAAYLPLTGYTLMLDHGHGVVSVFFHLSRIDVREGEPVEARTPLGASGDTGLVEQPHLHWGVYVHGVAVDPRVMERLTD